jgi:hypothetical protein
MKKVSEKFHATGIHLQDLWTQAVQIFTVLHVPASVYFLSPSFGLIYPDAPIPLTRTNNCWQNLEILLPQQAYGSAFLIAGNGVLNLNKNENDDEPTLQDIDAANAMRSGSCCGL